MPYTALLSFIRRLFASAPLERADEITDAVSEQLSQPSSAPMSDQELSRAIRELRDSPAASGAFQHGKESGREKKNER